MECINVFIGMENIKYELECHRQERSYFIVMCVCNLHNDDFFRLSFRRRPEGINT